MKTTDLTPKQRKFCENLVVGMSESEAYKSAYDTKSVNACRIEAHKLALRDDIQAYVSELRKPIVQRLQTKIVSEREKKRELCKARIQACIDANDDANARGWMDILNKMDAEYVNVNRNINETENEVVQLDTESLRKLANS